MTKEETGLRDLLSCTTLVQPSTVAIFQVLQRKTCVCVCVWPITLKPHISLWTLRYFQVCMNRAVTKDWQVREAGKVLACVHPGAWKTSFSTDPEGHQAQEPD